ncbi:MAG TPA: hypothetical protein VJG30_02885 [Candidatus Nanoarchaeia archaeon]|nr:hypothetical protein [Candidatus Nanoarchaeia archaeon]
MDINEQITRLKEFIEIHYKNKLYDVVHQGKKSLVLDFNELTHFDHEIADSLLDDPEDTVRAAELALEQFDLPKSSRLSRVKFRNLPETQKIKISEIRSDHLGKLLFVEGIVRQASDVRPQVTNAKFECAGCGNTISILQIDTKFKEPSRCTCGWRGKFRLLSKDLIDVQHLKIEESPERLEGGEQPKRLSIFLKEDLVEPKMEKKTAPGSKINIFGIVKEVPITLKTGAQSTRYDIIMDANNIESVQEDFSDIVLSKEDGEKIVNFSKDPKLFEKFTKAIAPSIYGHENIKDGLVLQLMGGVRREKPDGTTIRGDIHVLLVGDPGSAKSTLMQFISKAAPKARFVSGTSASGAGLTCAVVKDEFLKGWALEAGAMVLANKGICCLHPETKVLSNNKIISIEDLYNENIEEEFYSGKEKVFVHDLNINLPTFDLSKMEIFNTNSTKIRRKWHKGNLINIKLDSGNKILLTPDHKLINGSLLEWREAKNFIVNNFVLGYSKLKNFTEEKLYNEISNGDGTLVHSLPRDYFIDKIIEISEVPYEGYVYDLFVPGTHNFVAEGIIVHNCVDEIDKMTPEDRSALHSAMEQQIIAISKANVQATLSCQTTLLAAANPKLGRFDPYTPIPSQIDLPSTLINRFDLIFPVRDIPNKDKDEKIALHVLETSHKEETYKSEVSVDFMRKYIAYAKQNIKPKLTKAAVNEIKDFYVNLRNSNVGKEDEVRPIPISARQLEGLIRLTEASAKLRLDEKANREDARRAIELLKYCLMQVGLDPETGQIDIDRISSGISASSRSKILMIKEIVNNFDSAGMKTIPIDKIVSEAVSKGIEESKVEEVIEQLKKSGDIFEPKRGFISKVG